MVLALCLSSLPARAEEPPEDDTPEEITTFETIITSFGMADGKLSIKAEKTEQLTVQRMDSGELAGYTMQWSSSDDAIASVDDNGLLTAHTAGTVTITATVYPTGDDQNVASSATCEVTVTQATVASLLLEKSELTLSKDEGQILVASVTMDPSNSEKVPVTWSSEDETIAVVVSDSGKVTGLKAGQTTIIAKAGDKEARCVVTVGGLVISPTTLTLVAGSNATITKTLYGGGTGITYEWSSSDDTTARVDQNGKVTAGTAGTCTITVATSDGKYTAECKVTVTDNTAGVITDEISSGQPLRLSSLESEISDQCRSVLGSGLSYVTNLSVPTNQGILYYNYVSADDTGAGVGSLEKYYYSSAGKGQRSLSDITFLAKNDFSGTAEISYTGYNSSNQFFNGTIRVKVEATDDIVYSTGKDTAVPFHASDFSAVCRRQNGRDIDYVSFTLPSDSYGTLYYNYGGAGQLGTSVEGGTAYFRSKSPYVDNVTFVPAKGYTGTVRISYRGEDTSGGSFSGRITIYVSSGGGSTSERGDITYRTSPGEEVEFRVSDFNDYSRAVNGYNLDYVKFSLPSSSRGALYYDYNSRWDYGEKVSSSTSFYRNGSPALSRVSFVPEDDYSGTVSISFTGYDAEGGRLSGTVVITVGSGSGSSSSSGRTITYQTNEGEAVEFSASDFNDVCRNELGANLDYVRFTLPSSSKGTLYYDYTRSGGYDSKATGSTRYYRSGSPSLSRVSFVPKDGYTGTVSIDFTAYDVDGDRFTGTVRVKVGGGSSSSDGKVTYQTSSGRAVTFSASDFNSLCKETLGASLDYVRFTPPSGSGGTLYYNYTNSGSYDGKVSASTSYYRSGGSRQIDKVTFVPGGTTSSTVRIDFDGWDVNGDRFSGIVEITLKQTDSTIRYSVVSPNALSLRSTDFTAACRDATGNSLSYVQFTLPFSGQGTLHYDYIRTPNDRVSPTTNYYRTGGTRQLDKVSFVPASGYTGTVTFSYTGWSTGGDRFTGTVTVEVSSPVARALQYSTGSMPVTLQAEDFNSVCQGVSGKPLSHVRFLLPDSSVGSLYYRYTSPSSYDSQVNPSVSYYRDGTPELSRVSFVPSSSYQGTAILSYTGTDTGGGSYTGTVEITVTPGTNAGFRDMRNYAWAETAVDYLYQNGVVTGISAMEFGPGQTMTRADYVVMLCRAFGLNSGGTASFSDVPQDSYYAAAVATARDLNIVQDDGTGRFQPLNGVTRQDSMLYLQMAMRAAGWSLPDGSSSLLDRYSDGGSVAPYARGAMAAMIDLGVLQGNGSGQLNPGGILTRAEMAVLLYRALTL